MNKDYIELFQDENTGEFYKPYATIVCKTEEDFKNMQEALEKQVAKKPTHEATIQKCHTCPNCKNVLDRFDKTLYCMFCGQKLDWSEADENKEDN